MTAIRKIGVLTSGGDCSGLNAIIRAVARHAVGSYGWQVIGIEDGTSGLVQRPIKAAPLDDVYFTSEILRWGGTRLGTVNKGNPLGTRQENGHTVQVSDLFVEGCQELKLDALIAVGGDGSLKIIAELCRRAKIPWIGIPKTIDNDVEGTEFSVGYATAVDAVVEALDRLQPTAASHHRVMIAEVMGRDAGFIALSAGIAGGADVILMPEFAYDMQAVHAALTKATHGGRTHALMVVAEGIKGPYGDKSMVSYGAGDHKRYGGISHDIAHWLVTEADMDVRVTILGHTQRGGVPASMDRIMASAFGVRAVDLLACGRNNRVVAWQNHDVVDLDLSDVVGHTRSVADDDVLVRTARGLGVYIGDVAC